MAIGNYFLLQVSTTSSPVFMPVTVLWARDLFDHHNKLVATVENTERGEISEECGTVQATNTSGPGETIRLQLRNDAAPLAHQEGPALVGKCEALVKDGDGDVVMLDAE